MTQVPAQGQPTTAHPVSFKQSLFGVSSFFLSGIAITVFNKWFLHSYHFPILLTLVGSFFNTILCIFVAFLSPDGVVNSPHWITNIDRGFLLRLLPVGTLSALDIVSTTASFMFLSVSLVEIIKAQIPVLIFFSNVYRGKEDWSLSKFSTILLLISGVILSSRGDRTFDIRGVMLACLGTLVGAFRLVYVESVLTGPEKPHPLVALMYFAPVTFISLIVPFLVFEYEDLMLSDFLTMDNTPILLGAGAVLSFFLNVSYVLCVSSTSALTMCIVGILRLMFILLVSHALFDKELTVLNQVGIGVSLTGVVCYNLIRLYKLGLIRYPKNLTNAVYMLVSTSEEGEEHCARNEVENELAWKSEKVDGIEMVPLNNVGNNSKENHVRLRSGSDVTIHADDCLFVEVDRCVGKNEHNQ